MKDRTTPVSQSKLKHTWQNGWAVLRARWYFRKATKLGSRVRLWGKPSILNHGTMLIGDRVRINSTIAMVELAADTEGTLQIGDGAFINYGCSIAATQLVQIGPNCNIGTH